MKQRILWNSVQAVVGIILLFISYMYVSGHDAELTNFVSGMQILKDKVHYVVTSIGGKATMKDFQEQQSLERSYRELLHYIQTSWCTITQRSEEINAKLTVLTTLTPAEYKQHVQEYSSYATVVYREIQACIANKIQK
jgi:hypothetical protein